MLASILRNFEHIPTTDTMAFRRIASTKVCCQNAAALQYRLADGERIS